MRRWVILLAVMELAVLSMYIPSRPCLSPEAIAYPEKLVKPVFEDGRYVEPECADAGWATRANLGMIAYGVLTVCWLVALYWLGSTGGRLDRRTLIAVLIGGGVIAISLWALPPTFSLDSYRYRWDGLSIVSGYNPYELNPDSMGRLTTEHRPLLEATDFRWRPTIYPPFALFCFGINATLGNTMLGWRAMLLAAEAMLLHGCFAMLRRKGAEPGWLAAIALCPVLLMESHLDGHIELIPVALTVAGFVTLTRKQWWASAVLLALAVNVKYLWPGLAAFMLLGRLARQRRLIAGSGVFVLAIVACWLPFMMMSWSNVTAVSAGENWGAWLPLPVKLLLKAPREFLEHFNFNATIYRFLVEQFGPNSQMPKLIVLAVLLGLTGLLIWRRRWWMGIEDISLVLGAALLLSPVSYPWYFLWVAPGLMVIGRGELWRSVGPAVWVVFYLATVPALHEFIPQWIRTDRAWPLLPLPWLIVAAVVPLLTAAWMRRLLSPVLPATDALSQPS